MKSFMLETMAVVGPAQQGSELQQCRGVLRGQRRFPLRDHCVGEKQAEGAQRGQEVMARVSTERQEALS